MEESFLDFSPQLDIPGLVAAISVRTADCKAELKREQLIQKLCLPNQLCNPVQIHSATVRIVQQAGTYSATDGLITTVENLVLTLQVADCIPLYLVDTHRKVTGLIHAGWRGAASGIISQALEKMLQVGCRSEQIKAVIGPCLRSDNFEVGPEVARLFPKQFTQPGPEDRFLLDLPGFVIGELLESGFQAVNIFDSGLNTFSNPDQFHSFRRAGQAAGRMYALLGWANNPQHYDPLYK
ncbi:MAG: peptidoglycan editing factor PgeF [Candidatus Marinimicrobia bacterium]|nr:peptidoglycan editing factor PgeF [Candidatus Neomarinimicrobiota bacterium]